MPWHDMARNTHMHTYQHTYAHTCTCTHAYTQTPIHTHIHTDRKAGTQNKHTYIKGHTYRQRARQRDIQSDGNTAIHTIRGKHTGKRTGGIYPIRRTCRKPDRNT